MVLQKSRTKKGIKVPDLSSQTIPTETQRRVQETSKNKKATMANK